MECKLYIIMYVLNLVLYITIIFPLLKNLSHLLHASRGVKANESEELFL